MSKIADAPEKLVKMIQRPRDLESLQNREDGSYHLTGMFFDLGGPARFD